MKAAGRVPAAFGLALLLLTGCAPVGGTATPLGAGEGRASVSGSTSGAPTASERTAPPSSAPAAPSSSGRIPVRKATQAARDETRTPVRLDYPAIGAALDVVPVGVLDDGAMELPEDPAVGGWYRHGSTLGDPEGVTVIASHSGSPRNPLGALYGLRHATVGDEFAVTDAGGAVRRYRVTSSESLGKEALDFSPYFRRDGPPGVILITCGGEWLPDEGRYTENIVTLATPVDH